MPTEKPLGFQPMRSVTALVVFVLAVALGPAATPSTRQKAVVNMDMAPCSSSPGETAEMVQAAQDKDTAGYLALSDRDGNLLLSKGIRVDISAEGDGYDAIWISYGEHRGANCWIPSKMLTADTE